jgi:hypothetical protein
VRRSVRSEGAQGCCAGDAPNGLGKSCSYWLISTEQGLPEAHISIAMNAAHCGMTTRPRDWRRAHVGFVRPLPPRTRRASGRSAPLPPWAVGLKPSGKCSGAADEVVSLIHREGSHHDARRSGFRAGWRERYSCWQNTVSRSGSRPPPISRLAPSIISPAPGASIEMARLVLRPAAASLHWNDLYVKRG